MIMILKSHAHLEMTSPLSQSSKMSLIWRIRYSNHSPFIPKESLVIFFHNYNVFNLFIIVIAPDVRYTHPHTDVIDTQLIIIMLP